MVRRRHASVEDPQERLGTEPLAEAGGGVQVSDGSYVDEMAPPCIGHEPDVLDVAELIVAVRGGKPVYLQEVATIRDGPPRPQRVRCEDLHHRGARGSDHPRNR